MQRKGKIQPMNMDETVKRNKETIERLKTDSEDDDGGDGGNNFAPMPRVEKQPSVPAKTTRPGWKDIIVEPGVENDGYEF